MDEEMRLARERNEPPPVPTSLLFLAIGMIEGDSNAWFMRYLEFDVFKNTKTQIKSRTGINVEWIVAVALAGHAGWEHISGMMNDLLEQVKSQVTSSITIYSVDSVIQTGIIRYMRAQSVPTVNEEDENSEGNSQHQAHHG